MQNESEDALIDYNGNCYLHYLGENIEDYNDFVELFQDYKHKQHLNLKNDNEGNTPMHIASKLRGLEIIKYLINNGGKMDTKNAEGESCYQHLAFNKNMDVIKYFIEEKKIDFYEKSKNGNTFIHLAFKNNENIEMIKYFVESKYDLMITNIYGSTPLLFSFFNENFEIVKFLVEDYGLDLNMKNSVGNEPIHVVALINKNISILKYLIEEKKIDPFVLNDNKDNILHLACEQNENFEIGIIF